MTSNLYIGLMSGTSADGVDAVLVDCQSTTPSVIAHHYLRYEPHVRNQILALMQPGDDEISRMGSLDRQLGDFFAIAVIQLLQQAKQSAENIAAIGSHGQTIRHYPYADIPFTLQIGDPNTITAKTGIRTVADFRRKDMAFGGQGAPLVPRFHQAIFQTDHPRMVVNIGGIANVTLLPSLQDKTHPILGFDTGPGNALLDAFSMLHLNQPHDNGGQWAASGTIHQPLLEKLLADPYFKLPSPKSTGRDYFQLHWLQTQLDNLTNNIPPKDIAATLTELTALTIVNAIRQTGITTGEIVLCGGGVHNHYLLSRLQRHGAADFTIITSDALGMHPQLVEAIAFAWLAKQTLAGLPGNVPSVTGAKEEVILGGIYSS